MPNRPHLAMIWHVSFRNIGIYLSPAARRAPITPPSTKQDWPSMIQLPFEPGEYRRRPQAIREEMARRGLDLLIVNDVANQHYITGYDGWSFYTPQMVLVSLADEE